MLDFDGTLSPIARTPNLARLPEHTRQLLRLLCVRIPIIIISGRPLAEIKKKMKVVGLMYAGNHGLEWDMGKGNERRQISTRVVHTLHHVKSQLLQLRSEYPGLFIEDKKMSLAVHYRLVQSSQQNVLCKCIMALVGNVVEDGVLSVTHGKKVIELRPSMTWTKGSFAAFALRLLRKRNRRSLAAVYLGDDTTDEDVFKKLRSGIMIRIGYSRTSNACYYLDSQHQVSNFIAGF